MPLGRLTFSCWTMPSGDNSKSGVAVLEWIADCPKDFWPKRVQVVSSLPYGLLVLNQKLKNMGYEWMEEDPAGEYGPCCVLK